MKIVVRTTLTAACLAFFVTGAWAQTNSGDLPVRDMPYGLGMPKPKDSKKKSVSQHQQAKDLMADGKYEEAVPLLQRTVADDPRNDEAWYDLGVASQRLGQNSEALGYYDRTLTIRSARKDTRARLGEVSLALGNLAKAEEQLAQLRQICVTGCAELQSLETLIAEYKIAHPS